MKPLARAWGRLFLFQASWNYDRMVGVGMAHALEPLLAALPGGREGDRYRSAMARATSYFNAHPYLGAIAVGAEARAEHDGGSGERTARLRRALVGPLGSVGDQLFWAGVLPAAVGLGLALAVELGPLWGVLAFLVLYNAVHLVVRTWGLRAGWRLGRDVARAISGPGVRRALRLAGPVAAVALGFALPVVARWLLRDLAPGAQLAVGIVALSALVLERRVTPVVDGLRFGLILAVVAIVAGWLWP